MVEYQYTQHKNATVDTVFGEWYLFSASLSGDNVVCGLDGMQFVVIYVLVGHD